MILSVERRRRGWSRAELARRSAMNACTVGLIESKRFHPYDSQLKKLAAALDWPASRASELLEEQGGDPMRSGLRARGKPEGRVANP